MCILQGKLHIWSLSFILDFNFIYNFSIVSSWSIIFQLHNNLILAYIYWIKKSDMSNGSNKKKKLPQRLPPELTHQCS